MSVAQVAVQIERVVVDLALSEREAARLPSVLEGAFAHLARRLQAAGEISQLDLKELHVEGMSAGQLLASDGALRLAEQFWAQIHGARRAR